MSTITQNTNGNEIPISNLTINNGKRKRESTLFTQKKKISDYFSTSNEDLFVYKTSPFEETLGSTILHNFPSYYDGETSQFTLKRYEQGIHLPYFLSDRYDLHLHYLEKQFSEKLRIEFVTPQCFTLSQNKGNKFEFVSNEVLFQGRKAHDELWSPFNNNQFLGMDINDTGQDQASVLIYTEKNINISKCESNLNSNDIFCKNTKSNNNSIHILNQNYLANKRNKSYIQSHLHKPIVFIPLNGRASGVKWIKSDNKIILTHFHNGVVHLIDPNHGYKLRNNSNIPYDILDFEIINSFNLICGCRKGGIYHLDLRENTLNSSSNHNYSNNSNYLNQYSSNNKEDTTKSEIKSIEKYRRKKIRGISSLLNPSVSAASSSISTDKKSIIRCKSMTENLIAGGSEDGYLQLWDLRNLSIPIQSINLNTQLTSFDQKFSYDYSYMIDPIRSIEQNDPSIASRKWSNIPQSIPTLPSPISSLEFFPKECNSIVFQMQSGHIGCYNLLENKLTKYFFKYNTTQQNNHLRKSPLCSVPIEVTGSEYANFMFCSSQNFLYLLNFSDVHTNAIYSNIIEKRSDMDLIQKTKSSSFGSQPSLFMNAWDVFSTPVALQYLKEELWCLNESGHILKVSIN